MLALLIVAIGIAVVLVSSEYLWRRNLVRGEYARKYIHILAGIFVASWPYFMSMRQIQLVSVLALLVVIVSARLSIFNAINDVKRHTYGQYLYPIGVGLSALFANANWIFILAILFVALSDGMAAVIGNKWGAKSAEYKMFGMHKTYIGSLAYVSFAYVSLGLAALLGGSQIIYQHQLVMLLWLPVVTTFLEAVTPYGLDNITIPLLVVLACNMLLPL